MKELFDYHIQTIAHGVEQPLLVEDTIKAAIACGFRTICITDHYPLPPGFIDPTEEQDCSMPAKLYFGEYLSRVEQSREKYADQIRVCYGAEFDWLRDYEDWTTKQVGIRPYDYLIGSVHFVPDETGQYHIIDYTESVFRQAIKSFGSIQSIVGAYYQEVRSIVRSGFFDAVGHIDLIKKYNSSSAPLFSEEEEWYREEVLLTLDKIAEVNMPIEINTAGWFKKCQAQYPSFWIMQAAFIRDIPLTLGSDAHRPEEVGRKLEEAVELAKMAGYRKLVRFRQREMIKEEIA